MRILSTAFCMAMVATASSADAVARAVDLCMGIPLDGTPVSETFVSGGWEAADENALALLADAHACGDSQASSELSAQFKRTLAFSGGVFAMDEVIVLAADNRGGDIVDRICFMAALEADSITALMAELPVIADRVDAGYTARETAPENFVEAFGWRGDHQIHAGRCADVTLTDVVKIRRLLRKIPQ